MSDTGSGEQPTTPRWAGVHRTGDAESAAVPQTDPTPVDAWGTRTFSPYDVSPQQTPDAPVEAAEDGADEAVEPGDEPDAGDEASADVTENVPEPDDVEDSADEEEAEPEPDDATASVDAEPGEQTEVMEAVEFEPPATPYAEEVPAADPDGSDDVADEPEAAHAEGNPLGVWAVVTGILLIFPAAIVLGHLGLRAAAREGRARTAALAGLILGYLGLVVAGAAVALWIFVFGPQIEEAEVALQAQADVTAVGNAVAAHFETSAAEPTLRVTDAGYAVDDAEVEALLSGERDVTLDFSTTTEWCVELSYGEEFVSYVGATGYADGSCG